MYRLFALAALLIAPFASAQTEIESARVSLAGLSELGIEVTIEKPLGASTNEALRLDAATGSLRARLIENGVPARERKQDATLRVHVNVMRAEGGRFPFSVELDLEQPAFVNGRLVPAITWSDSLVGLAFEADLSVVQTAILALADEFSADYRAAN
ncbi:MAG: hypothetical protein AAGI08_09445 [Bacteroidota bacterium]